MSKREYCERWELTSTAALYRPCLEDREDHRSCSHHNLLYSRQRRRVAGFGGCTHILMTAAAAAGVRMDLSSHKPAAAAVPHYAAVHSQDMELGDNLAEMKHGDSPDQLDTAAAAAGDAAAADSLNCSMIPT